MILGITGTREEPTNAQLRSFLILLKELGPVEFHHGCCTGADTITSKIISALDPGIVIVGHPPIITTMIGNYKSNFDWVPKDYMDRNKDIVDVSEVLIGLVPTEYEIKRSGTWSTIRYARRKKNKKYYVIKPDGTY